VRQLTETERDVLRMLAGGMKTSEIAFALDTSEPAIDSHVAAIMSKLGTASPETAVTTAIAADLISTEL